MTTGDSDSASSPGSAADIQKSRNGRSSHRKNKDSSTKIIQVVNIAPQAKKEEIQTLFGYLGKIDDIRLYPTLDIGMTVPSKICFIKFYESNSVGISQHLTNTVFIDRALIVVPYMENEIPDEQKGMELLNSGSLLPGIADPKLPQHVTSQLEGYPPNQVVATHDPKLVELGLPPYPHLLPTLDARKIEEIRRTVMIGNLDPELSSQEVVDHFSSAGEVKYFRFCTRDNDPLHYGLLEFSEQPSILEAMKMNGTQFGSKTIKVYHAAQSILKPQAKSNEAAQKEIEDALSRQTFLPGTMENKGSTSTQHMGIRPEKRSRSRDRRRSRSRERRRSRSRSKRRSSSRSKRRSRSRGTHGRSKKKSRSRSRDRRRSRSKKRSKSPSSRHRKRSKSRSRSKDRSRKKEKKDKEKDKDRKEKDREKEHRKEKENGIKKEETKVSANSS